MSDDELCEVCGRWPTWELEGVHMPRPNDPATEIHLASCDEHLAAVARDLDARTSSVLMVMAL